MSYSTIRTISRRVAFGASFLVVAGVAAVNSYTHMRDVAILGQLCRWHHVRVHEGGWRIELDRYTGELAVYRPDGCPYEIPPSQPWLSPTTRRGDPPAPTTRPPTRTAA